MNSKERAYSGDIARAIDAFLKDDDWHYSFEEREGLFKFGLGVKGRLKKLRYLISVGTNHYVVYATAPIGADEDDPKMMREMSDFICRANYGLKNGNFELDMDDGEIRYKTYVDCRDAVPGAGVIKGSIYCPAAMFDRYSPGIIDIIFNDAGGKESVEKCEGSADQLLRSLCSSTDREEEDDDSESSGGSGIDSLLAQLLAHLGTDTASSESDHEEPDEEPDDDPDDEP